MLYDAVTDSYQPTRQIPVGGAAWIFPHSSPDQLNSIQIYLPTPPPHP
ncbi:MAG: hypothetical protein ACYDCQ_22645 [Dehalococcoidia bacterium]